jgi:hypothetical protein
MKPPEVFGIPFKLVSDPDSSIQSWELELFTCRFLLSHYPDIHELYEESRVIITRDSHRMYVCKTLEEATEFLKAQLQPSLMLVISKRRKQKDAKRENRIPVACTGQSDCECANCYLRDRFGEPMDGH